MSLVTSLASKVGFDLQPNPWRLSLPPLSQPMLTRACSHGKGLRKSKRRKGNVSPQASKLISARKELPPTRLRTTPLLLVAPSSLFTPPPAPQALPSPQSLLSSAFKVAAQHDQCPLSLLDPGAPDHFWALCLLFQPSMNAVAKLSRGARSCDTANGCVTR